MLIEACKLCIENDVFIRELKVLDFFNNDVTFSFLNCIENCNQKDILPNLFHDLINNSTDTLSKYKLTMEHINTQKPGSKLSQKIFEDFFLAAVEVIKTQCGREYRFVNENEKTRATFFQNYILMNWKVYQQITSKVESATFLLMFYMSKREHL